MVAIATFVIGACAPAGASAKTVGPGANGKAVAVTQGKSLVIKLTPANSGSTGFHWRVAKKPSSAILKLKSNRTRGARQVFTYTALSARTTSLKLQYVRPGRGAAAVKTFRLKVFVAESAPRAVGCGFANYDGPTIARDDVAIVFAIGRTAVAKDGPTLARFGYQEYYGCTFSQNRPFRLDTGDLSRTVTGPADDQWLNVTLRGTVVGYEFAKGCPFVDEGNCEEGFPPLLETQDLSTGKLIRSVRQVFVDQVGATNVIAGFVMSRTGGLAWIETNVFPGEHGGTVQNNVVHRSDAPPRAGEEFATDQEVLDPDDQSQVDPESLELDDTEVTWRRGGELERATLR